MISYQSLLLSTIVLNDKVLQIFKLFAMCPLTMSLCSCDVIVYFLNYRSSSLTYLYSAWLLYGKISTCFWLQLMVHLSYNLPVKSLALAFETVAMAQTEQYL